MRTYSTLRWRQRSKKPRSPGKTPGAGCARSIKSLGTKDEAARADSIRDVGVAGSNPATPTSFPLTLSICSLGSSKAHFGYRDSYRDRNFDGECRRFNCCRLDQYLACSATAGPTNSSTVI